MPRATGVQLDGPLIEPTTGGSNSDSSRRPCPARVSEWLLLRKKLALGASVVLLVLVAASMGLQSAGRQDSGKRVPPSKEHRPTPVPPSPTVCSGHGRLINGTCFCDGMWGGSSCTRQLSPYFQGSRLILSQADGLLLNQWLGGPAGQQYNWTLCFSSFVHPADDASVYHAQCDDYQLTLTVARNALGFTFGGLARGSFGYAQCCKVRGNSCAVPNVCFCQESCAADFIFKLAPGDPTKYAPTGTDHDFQDAEPKHWPCWGTGDDLLIGKSGPPGQGAKCKQGHTYAGNESEACGGGVGTWGHTDIEVWRMI